MDNNDGFVERLKKIREALNFNQREFSSQLDISEASYSEFENGKHKPRYGFLYKIAKEFHVNLYYLLFGEGEMFIDRTGTPANEIEDFAVNREDFKEFMWYFRRSRILQYLMLGHYRTIMQTNRESIEKEVEEYNSRQKP
jgi:transcriptional regulator with XRE-family HTH domain